MEAFDTAHLLWICLDTNQLISIIHDLRGGQSSYASGSPTHWRLSAYHRICSPQQTHTHTQTQTDRSLITVWGCCVQRNMQDYRLDKWHRSEITSKWSLETVSSLRPKHFQDFLPTTESYCFTHSSIILLQVATRKRKIPWLRVDCISNAVIDTKISDFA